MASLKNSLAHINIIISSSSSRTVISIYRTQSISSRAVTSIRGAQSIRSLALHRVIRDVTTTTSSIETSWFLALGIIKIRWRPNYWGSIRRIVECSSGFSWLYWGLIAGNRRDIWSHNPLILDLFLVELLISFKGLIVDRWRRSTLGWVNSLPIRSKSCSLVVYRTRTSSLFFRSIIRIILFIGWDFLILWFLGCCGGDSSRSNLFQLYFLPRMIGWSLVICRAAGRGVLESSLYMHFMNWSGWRDLTQRRHISVVLVGRSIFIVVVIESVVSGAFVTAMIR